MDRCPLYEAGVPPSRDTSAALFAADTAATVAATELVYLREIIAFVDPEHELGMTTLYCDNSAACQLAESALSGKQVKHVMRRLISK